MMFDPQKKYTRKPNFEPQVFDMELPFPISINALHAPIGDNKIGLTRRAKEYYGEMTRLLVQEDFGMMTGRIKAEIWVCDPDKRRRDINNLTKSLFDALQMCKVFEDDSQIDETHIYRSEICAGGKVRVRLIEIKESDDRKTMAQQRTEGLQANKDAHRAELLKDMCTPTTNTHAALGRWARK